MLAGGSAGVTMWALAIPPDVSHRHVQLDFELFRMCDE